jgi:hypothetical protein
MVKTLVLSTVLALGATVAAEAQALKPLEASVLDLGAAHGTAFYTAEPNGYRVVATLDTGSEKPIRFGAILAAGQTATVSVPAGVGEPAIEITFVRTDAGIEVRRAGVPADAITALTR